MVQGQLHGSFLRAKYQLHQYVFKCLGRTKYQYSDFMYLGSYPRAQYQSRVFTCLDYQQYAKCHHSEVFVCLGSYLRALYQSRFYMCLGSYLRAKYQYSVFMCLGSYTRAQYQPRVFTCRQYC